jgi:hypothetical protein
MKWKKQNEFPKNNVTLILGLIFGIQEDVMMEFDLLICDVEAS